MLHSMRIWIAKRRELWYYLFFGFLTTVLNYAVYLPLYNLTAFPAAFSNSVAWLAAVVFAFVTNKLFVFRSPGWSRAAVVPEFIKFIGWRLASGVIETGIIFVTVDLLRMDGNIMKFLTSILVVILNYIGSKLLVFRSKKP